MLMKIVVWVVTFCTASEKVFSLCGVTMSNKRTRLNPFDCQKSWTLWTLGLQAWLNKGPSQCLYKYCYFQCVRHFGHIDQNTCPKAEHTGTSPAIFLQFTKLTIHWGTAPGLPTGMRKLSFNSTICNGKVLTFP